MPQFKLVAPADFHRLARAGQARGVGVMRQSASVLRSDDDVSRLRRWRFSDGSTDRLGDRINPSGWSYDNYLRAGGPVLFAHDSMAPPIGGTRSLSSNAVALTGEIEFADAETYEFADTVLKLIDAGFLKGGSVGFMPTKWTYSDDPGRRGGIDFIEQELLEFSIAPVPALPTALLEARSLFGIDTAPVGRWAERALGRGNAMLSRSELLRLRDVSALPALVTDLTGARRDRDLLRARAIAERVERQGGPMIEAEPDWRQAAAAQLQREADERLARGRQVAEAIRISTPVW